MWSDDARQFVGSGRDGFWSPEFGAHPAIEVPQIGLAVIERLRGQAKCRGRSILDLACFDRQHFPAADRLSGHSPSQDVKAGPLADRGGSGPISAKRVCVVGTCIPGTFVRSTPKIRWR